MPRDASGNYTLPAGNPVVTGSVISSSWANTTLDDIKTALTQSLATTGVSTMTGAIKMADGSAGVPSILFGSDPDTGVYLSAANRFGFVSNGSLAAFLDVSDFRVLTASARFEQSVTILTPAAGDSLIVGPSNTTGALMATTAALGNAAGAAAGTLLNAPAAGDPTKWIKINDNGTIRAIPAW